MKQREANDRNDTHKAIDKLKEEFLAILPPTIFRKSPRSPNWRHRRGWPRLCGFKGMWTT